MNDPQFAVTYCPFKVELILEGKDSYEIISTANLSVSFGSYLPLEKKKSQVGGKNTSAHTPKLLFKDR